MSEELDSDEVDAQAFRQAHKKAIENSNINVWKSTKKKLKSHKVYVEQTSGNVDYVSLTVPRNNIDYVSTKALNIGFSLNMLEADDPEMVDLYFSWKKDEQ